MDEKLSEEPDLRAAIEAELRAAGELADEELNIGGVALALAQWDNPGKDRTPYLTELEALTDAVRESLVKAEAPGADMIAMVLANIISGRFSYRGDTETYDDPKNADLMAVIDRRKGLPVSLGILYLHVGRALGLDLAGLNFPGHFILRLQAGPEATIIDPFNRGQTLTTADLLNLLRSIEGQQARLIPEHHVSVSPRDILLRLQNNILSRALGAGEYDRARDVVSRMIWFAPDRAGLQFELGRIEIHAGHMGAAASAFEACRNMASDAGDRRVADMASEALKRLKAKLN
ncbi:MAG: transglutaminase-like domain-containing protein [Parvibaculum sp.]|nr:transglutaminase-like domain-containing protein [Parvibaculum sp.]